MGGKAGPEELGVGPSSLETVSVWLKPSTQAPDPSAPSVSVAQCTRPFPSPSPVPISDGELD